MSRLKREQVLYRVVWTGYDGKRTRVYRNETDALWRIDVEKQNGSLISAEKATVRWRPVEGAS